MKLWWCEKGTQEGGRKEGEGGREGGREREGRRREREGETANSTSCGFSIGPASEYNYSRLPLTRPPLGPGKVV